MVRRTRTQEKQAERPTKRQLLTTGEAARILGVSTDRVRQLDQVLKPHRTESGQRLYDYETVVKLELERRLEALNSRGGNES